MENPKDSEIASFSRFHIPLIKKLLKSAYYKRSGVLADKLIDVAPMPQGAVPTFEAPILSEFTVAIALWVEENYPQLNPVCNPRGALLTTHRKNERYDSKLSIECFISYCAIMGFHLAYEDPRFFDQVARIIDYWASDQEDGPLTADEVFK